MLHVPCSLFANCCASQSQRWSCYAVRRAGEGGREKLANELEPHAQTEVLKHYVLRKLQTFQFQKLNAGHCVKAFVIRDSCDEASDSLVDHLTSKQTINTVKCCMCHAPFLQTAALLKVNVGVVTLFVEPKKRQLRAGRLC